MIRFVLVLIGLAALICGEELDTVKAEPNLEKRSQMALDAADTTLTAAKAAYDDGKLEDFRSRVDTIGDLAELSYSSLDETGKRARRNPKWFKRAEQRMLVLLRRIGNLEKDVSVDDKETVATLRKRVSGVHERLLTDIMTKK